MSTKQQPVSKIDAYFPIVAAIWRNPTNDGRSWYSVKFQRRYKDDAGAWQSSDNFNNDDLLTLAKVANLAHTEVYKLLAADRAAQREPGEEG